jgi:membrane-bound serine protease (ClpP class)
LDGPLCVRYHPGTSCPAFAREVGTETMLGKTVTALTSVDARGGKVFVEGEYWNATSDAPIQGQPVEITAVEGLTVKVKPQAG